MPRHPNLPLLACIVAMTISTSSTFPSVSFAFNREYNHAPILSRHSAIFSTPSPYTNSEGDDLLEWCVDESDITPMSLIDGDHHNVFKEFSELIQIHQASIVDRIHAHEPTNRFTSDAWTGDGSNGLTRVIQDGSVVDKGAVSTSYIHSGVLSPARAKTMKARGVSVPNDGRYNAAALSLVLHTRNPHVPTFRSDVRWDKTNCKPHYALNSLGLARRTTLVAPLFRSSHSPHPVTQSPSPLASLIAQNVPSPRLLRLGN